MNHATIKTISLLGLQRARTTLEDFALSYMPYLGLDPAIDFFKYLDVLVWLEASVYEIDEHNEIMCKNGLRAPSRRLAGAVIPLSCLSYGTVCTLLAHY